MHDEPYDEHILQINRHSNKVVWHLKIQGFGCKDPQGCPRTAKTGWKIYSVDHFYEHPLVSNVFCSRAENYFSFDTHNIFKQNDAYPGTFTLRSAELVVTGQFHFEPHWRTTTVRRANLDLDRRPQCCEIAIFYFFLFKLIS